MVDIADTNSFDTPVLIIGSGPTGILASLLLTKLCIHHTVIDKKPGLHKLPQAHVVKLRTMEILRRFGLDAPVLKNATSIDFLKYVTWKDTLSGTEFGKLSMIGRKGASNRYESISPTFPANLPQDEYEQILFGLAKESRYAEFKFATTCVDVSECDGGMVVHTTSESQGNADISARFVIAADGASSSTRRDLGVQFVGDRSLQKFITMVVSADLREIVKDAPGVLQWVNSPACRGTFIIHNPDRRFVFMVPYDEATSSPEHYTEEVCLDLLRKAIGKDIPMELIGIDRWNMSAQVAEKFSTGNLFIAGDAAHRFPPTGGMGLNTGAQDINNLIWKIAMVLNGKAPQSLLDTYEIERKPVAEVNCAHSKSNYLKMAQVEEAIFGEEEWLKPGRLAFLNSQSAAADAEREKIRLAIENQLEHFDTIFLDLAYRYKSDAIIDDAFEAPGENDVVHEFAPFCRSGYRFPHLRLEQGGTPVSSLDLMDYGLFSLFCKSKETWQKEVSQLPEQIRDMLQILEIGPGSDIKDIEGDWARMAEINEQGAILVRPDGQVAWRYTGEGERSFDSIAAVMESILGSPSSC